MTLSSPDSPDSPPIEPRPASLVADTPLIERSSQLDNISSGDSKKKLNMPWWLVVVVCVFLVGLGWGYVLGASRKPLADAGLSATIPLPTPPPLPPTVTSSPSLGIIDQVNPPQGYTLTISFGDLGPRLVAAGAIDSDRFAQVYQDAGQPLTAAQREILTKGSQAPIVVNRVPRNLGLAFKAAPQG